MSVTMNVVCCWCHNQQLKQKQQEVARKASFQTESVALKRIFTELDLNEFALKLSFVLKIQFGSFFFHFQFFKPGFIPNFRFFLLHPGRSVINEQLDVVLMCFCFDFRAKQQLKHPLCSNTTV